MLNLENSITLGKDIYVFHNFISKEECLNIIKEINSIPESKWEGRFNEGGQGYEVAHSPMSQIEDLRKRLIAILDKDVNLGSSSVPTRMKKGYVGTHHSDNSDFLKVVENNPVPSAREKKKIYEKYSKLFFDQPPKKTRWG